MLCNHGTIPVELCRAEQVSQIKIICWSFSTKVSTCCNFPSKRRGLFEVFAIFRQNVEGYSLICDFRCNMKLAIIFTAVFGVLLGLGLHHGLVRSGGKGLLVLNAMFSGLYYGEPHCPHPAFIPKHWCQDCTSEEDVLVFSQHRSFETGRNTVLAGFTTFDRDPDDSEMCKNVEPTRAYQCNLGPGGTCRLLGNHCTSVHHTYTGHMFYQNVECY
jgi:hypothetical protein